MLGDEGYVMMYINDTVYMYTPAMLYALMFFIKAQSLHFGLSRHGKACAADMPVIPHSKHCLLALDHSVGLYSKHRGLRIGTKRQRHGYF